MLREDAIKKQEKNLVGMIAALFKADKVVFTDHRSMDHDDERFNEMVRRFMKGANHSGTTLTARVMHETMRVLSEDPIEVDESDDSKDEGDDSGDEGEGLSDHFGFEQMVSTAPAHLSKNKQGSGGMAESNKESPQEQQQEYSGAPGTEYTPVEPRRQLLSNQRMSEMDNSGARVVSPPNKEKGNKRKAGASGEAGGVQPPLSKTQAKKQRKAKEAAERAAAAKKAKKKKQRKEAAARSAAKAPASGN